MPVLANSVKTQCEDSKYQFPFKQFFTKLLYVYIYIYMAVLSVVKTKYGTIACLSRGAHQCYLSS